jgi:hypothetical protein
MTRLIFSRIGAFLAWIVDVKINYAKLISQIFSKLSASIVFLRLILWFS